MRRTETRQAWTFDRLTKWAAIGFAVVLVGGVLFVTSFYVEENWRGKRAWEQCKRELSAEGPVLEWASYVPDPIPAEQNIFKAPGMSERFENTKQNDLDARLSQSHLAEFVRDRNSGVLAEVTIISSKEAAAAGEADVRLDYRPPLLTVLNKTEQVVTNISGDLIIPMILMDDVPLTDAIRNLAKQAGLEYSLDYVPWDENGAQPSISMRWENVTAMDVLAEVINNNGLESSEPAKNGVVHISLRSGERPIVRVDALAIRALNGGLAPRLAEGTNSPETTAKGSQGISLHLEPRNVIPARILVRADKLPGTNEVRHFFRPLGRGDQPFVAEVTGSNSFRLFSTRPTNYAAADYLAWSDQFTNDFSVIREALKRPFARLDGDYQKPDEIPVPNMSALRTLAQTLGQRAQCLLLCGKREQAAAELALLHDLPRLLAGKPTTLLRGMFTVAIMGVYLDVVAEGLRRHQWREPELHAMEAQLQQIDLLPIVLNASLEDRAAACRILETRKFKFILEDTKFRFNPISAGEQRLKNFECWLLGFVPQGWIYQNMVEVAKLDEQFIQSYDPLTHRIFPTRLDAAAEKQHRMLGSARPHSFLAQQLVFDQTRAWRTAALSQVTAECARVACALERFHSTNGNYPEALDSLRPEFIQSLPGDLLAGQPLRYRLIGHDHFLIYSVGWNGKDDGGIGTNLQDYSYAADSRGDDWIWEEPPPGVERAHVGVAADVSRR